MDARLILLGAIIKNEKPIHGYELKVKLEESAIHYFTDLSYGRVYYYLDKMEKEGLIKSTSLRDTNRPERTVYETTRKGRIDFIDRLSKNLFDVERTLFSVDIGINLIDMLEPEEARTAIEKRIYHYKDELKYVEILLKELDEEGATWNEKMIVLHLKHYQESELAWLGKVLEHLKQ